MKVALARLSTKNIATLAQRIIYSSKNNTYKVVENHPLLLELESQSEVYDKLFAKQTFSGKGVEVAEADSRRDEPFEQIKGMVRAHAAIPSLASSKAAVEVLDVIETYGIGLSKLSYAEETAQMGRLIVALDAGEMQANLTALNLLPTYGLMKQAQADFEALYATQLEVNAELRNLPSATSARKELEQAIRAYLDLLTAMRTVEGWEMIYAEVNEIVKAAAR
jgi:type I site-specific restriction endonuclease